MEQLYNSISSLIREFNVTLQKIRKHYIEENVLNRSNATLFQKSIYQKFRCFSDGFSNSSDTYHAYDGAVMLETMPPYLYKLF